MVVSGPPGSLTDQIARILAQFLGRVVGSDIFVENRAGAGGLVAALDVSRAVSDGSTLLFASSETVVYAPWLIRNTGVDVSRDLKPVSLVARTPLALAVSPSSGILNTKDLVAKAKANPNRLTFATPLSGTTRFATEEFKKSAGVQAIVVPYKGLGPAAAAVVSGEVTAAFLPLPAIRAARNSGRLKVLAVTAPSRSDLPTFTQQGFSSLDTDQWFAILAPKGTTDKVIGEINRAVSTAIKDPDFRARLASLEVTPDAGSPKELEAQVRRDTERWARLTKELSIKPQ